MGNIEWPRSSEEIIKQAQELIDSWSDNVMSLIMKAEDKMYGTIDKALHDFSEWDREQFKHLVGMRLFKLAKNRDTLVKNLKEFSAIVNLDSEAMDQSLDKWLWWIIYNWERFFSYDNAIKTFLDDVENRTVKRKQPNSLAWDLARGVRAVKYDIPQRNADIARLIKENRHL